MKMDKEVILVFVILFWLFAFGIAFAVLDDYAKGKACREKGFEKYIGGKGIPMCKDHYGNFHYIRFDCNGFIRRKCTAKSISVGDVRVKGGV